MPFGKLSHNAIFDMLRQADNKNLRAFCDNVAEKLYLCSRNHKNKDYGSNYQQNTRTGDR